MTTLKNIVYTTVLIAIAATGFNYVGKAMSKEVIAAKNKATFSLYCAPDNSTFESELVAIKCYVPRK